MGLIPLEEFYTELRALMANKKKSYDQKDRVAEILLTIRGRGVKLVAIADELGIPKSTLSSYASDYQRRHGPDMLKYANLDKRQTLQPEEMVDLTPDEKVEAATSKAVEHKAVEEATATAISSFEFKSALGGLLVEQNPVIASVCSDSPETFAAFLMDRMNFAEQNYTRLHNALELYKKWNNEMAEKLDMRTKIAKEYKDKCVYLTARLRMNIEENKMLRLEMDAINRYESGLIKHLKDKEGVEA